MFSTWIQLTEKLHKKLYHGFYRIGHFAGRRPVLAIVIGLATAILLSAGVLLLETEKDVYYMTDTQAYQDRLRLDAQFDRSFHFPSLTTLILLPKLVGANILDQNHLEAAFALHQQVLTSTSLNGQVAFMEVCARDFDGGDCNMYNIFSLLNITTESEVIAANIAAALEAREELRPYVDAVGGYSSGGSPTGEALLFLYPEDGKESKESLREQWEEGYIKFVESEFKTNALLAGDFNNEWLVNYETEQLINREVPLIGGTITIIMAYMCFILGGRPFRHSRILLGSTTILTVILSLAISFGLTGYFGLPYVVVDTLAIFVLLGVGVDDIIIVLDSIDRVDKSLSIEEQLAEGFGHAGYAISVTTMTSFFALLTASTIDFPIVRYFCLTSSLGIAAVFFLQATFFAGCVALDLRRRSQHKYDMLPCISFTPTEKEIKDESVPETKRVASWMRNHLGPFQSKGRGRIIVLIVFVIVFGVSIFGVTKISSETDLVDFYPKDSHQISINRLMKRYFYDNRDELWLAVGDVDYTDEDIRNSILSVQDELLNMPNIYHPEHSWLRSFTYYVDDASINLTPATFYDRLADFMNNTDPFDYSLNGTVVRIIPAEYHGDIAMKDGRIVLSTSYYPFAFASSQKRREEIVKELRDVLKNASEPTVAETSFIWSWSFEVTDRDEKMPSVIVVNLVYTVLAVGLVLLLFVHPGLAVIIIGCIVMIDTDILGLLSLWDVSLDVGSFISLVISIGLSVDYVVHIGHTYVHTRNIPQAQRVSVVMEEMGASVFNGGFSTFLGVCLLGFSQSRGFQQFFKVLFACILFGVLHGVLFAPIVLQFLFRQKNRRTTPAESLAGSTAGDIEDQEELEAVLDMDVDADSSKQQLSAETTEEDSPTIVQCADTQCEQVADESSDTPLKTDGVAE